MPILQKTSTITTQLLSALESAEKEILLHIYYVDDDAVFAEYTKRLIAKSAQGVSVYCLFDALGASQISGSVAEQRLLAAGVHIQYFNWLTPWTNNNKKILYFRDHKRALIIDRAVLHTGGWCIGEKTENWIEGYIQTTDVETVQSSVVDFWNMYTYAHKTKFRFTHQKKYTYTKEKAISYTYQAPILRGRYIYYTHKKFIQTSTKKIVLITPYFAPIHPLKKVIYAARKRGVEVELYIPKSTDTTLVDLVTKTYVHTLLKLGVSVYFSDVMVHAKVCLFDDTLYVGSMNLDSVSLRYNFENGIYTKDISMVAEFEKDLIILKNSCHLITLAEWNNRTLGQKFLDRFMKLFRAFV